MAHLPTTPEVPSPSRRAVKPRLHLAVLAARFCPIVPFVYVPCSRVAVALDAKVTPLASIGRRMRVCFGTLCFSTSPQGGQQPPNVAADGEGGTTDTATGQQSGPRLTMAEIEELKVGLV
ncbi:unnamed protein product [Acanthoscelides obtectus]|uniref:Uncharacterized protein n=1 Tax=Acanthoscelides obtectus TaxID=200917 RepID=A0A9P0PED8_ACAOB|nr:unnamed protein product [Acanthoscelides obtectus]CAK1638244.1 hypothetical protein AOBTE_LOCUS10479 [Acanthoscelides obtectus]